MTEGHVTEERRLAYCKFLVPSGVFYLRRHFSDNSCVSLASPAV